MSVRWESEGLQTVGIVCLVLMFLKLMHLLGLIDITETEGLDQLQVQTKFTKKELQSLYRGYKNECPSGLVDEETFKTIYSQFFPQGDATTYAHFLFNAFDMDRNGSIRFEDFVIGLSVLLRGSVTEKLNWAFNLYDINKDGYITKEKMDRNRDGVVTIEEFIETCQKSQPATASGLKRTLEKEKRRDETRRDETRRDETRRDETRRDETRRDETRTTGTSATLKLLSLPKKRERRTKLLNTADPMSF
ncbi:unnamed protein product [Coregonus sp. 'balchen']|nr:unnamed protein product [Coregonus sp. 'balchen']